MAQLGRGQPFAPQVKRAVIPLNQNIHGSTATVTVQAFMGSVYVEPPVPEQMPFRIGQARIGQANPGEPGSLASPNGNVQGSVATVTVTAPMGVVGVTYPGSVATVAVAGHDKVPQGTVTEPAATITVQAFDKAPTVTFPGQVATVSVQGYDAPANGTVTESPANVNVVALYGHAFSGIVYAGQVGQVTVQAYDTAPKVSTPGPSVLYATGFESGIPGWGKYDNTSHGANLTLAQSGAQSHSGASSALLGITGTVASPIATYGMAAPANVPFTISAWVYSPQGYNGAFAGMDWYTSSSGSYITTTTGSTVNVPANTWTFVTATFTVPATATWVHAKIGLSGSPSTSIQLYIDDVTISVPAYELVAAYDAPPGVTVNGSAGAVAVAAPMGIVSVSPPASVATVTVAAYDAPPSVSVSEQPAGVSAFTPGQNLSQNSFFFNGSTAFWAGFHGTITGSTSPPAGCPYPAACEWVNNGVSAGALEGGGNFTATPSTQYAMGAWVYTSLTQVQIGFDWLSSGHAYLSTSSVIINVPSNTWTWVSMTAVSNASAAYGYCRVGSSLATGETVWATGIQSWLPSQSGQAGIISVSTPGSTAAVTVAAPYGNWGIGPPTPAPASVAVAALYGTVSVSTPGSAASASVAAPSGRPGTSPPSSAASITIAAPMGTASVSTSMVPATVTVAAFGGLAQSTVQPGPAVVVVAAPYGRASVTTTGSTAGVSVAASMNYPAVSVVTAAPNCMIATPYQAPSVSTPGQPASVSVAAPLSPLVAALYIVNAQALSGFTGKGSGQRRVWFGYTDIRSMNVQT